MMEKTTMVRLERQFSHPAARVFNAFLEPETLPKWYGPRFATVGATVVEPVVGGRFDVELLSDRFGSMWVKGHFKEIKPYDRLVFTFIFDPDPSDAGDSVVTVEFKEQQGQTQVVLLQVLGRPIDPRGRTEGWTDIFDKLDAFLHLHP